MAETATDRLARLLAMVPWLLNRQGVDIVEAAQAFGITPEQVEADLALLFLCGTPGGMPDDLIEADWEGGRVFLGNADTISRPLRLGLDEALTLIVGLRTLAAVPGIGDRDAIDRALAKLVDATGTPPEASETATRIQVDITEGVAGETLEKLRRALTEHRRLRLRYLVPARDESTDRDVDPMRVFSAEGHWYLEGWCHRAQDTRLFRLDRIESLEVLDVDGTPPAQAVPRDLDEGVFRAGAEDLLVELDLGPDARWVADYYPLESSEDLDGGRLLVRLRTADTGWLRRMVLRLGGSAVVRTEPLATEVREAAAAALAAYDE